MLNQCLKKLMQHEILNEHVLFQGLEEMILGENIVQIAAFLSALSIKKENTAEIMTVIQFMRKMMMPLKINSKVLDIVGTGGDGYNTLNISTGSAILAAACGVKVAKHGNHSSSSLTGSADVLQALGLKLSLSEETINQSIANHNFGFCYAPQYHIAFKKLKHIRQTLGVPTLFNLIGPLLHPAKADFMMIGVANKQKLPQIAEILLSLQVERAMVFHGCGLDEISTLGNIDIIEIKNHTAKEKTLNPLDYGFKLSRLEDLKGGDAQYNAAIIQSALKGKCSAVSDTFVFNAGIANYLYGLTPDISEGIALAQSVHRAGLAYKSLQNIIEASHV
jgi:anthranilate phosphoribosyltransferase